MALRNQEFKNTPYMANFNKLLTFQNMNCYYGFIPLNSTINKFIHSFYFSLI